MNGMNGIKEYNDEDGDKEVGFFIDCACGDMEHHVNLKYFWLKGDEKNFPPDIYIEMKANDYTPFWRRVVQAFKYVFNKREFRSTIETHIRKEDIPNIKMFLDKYISDYNKWVKDNAQQ